MTDQIFTFPKDFVWGTATASYQIEGAWNIDGKGESIWDRFSHTPGKIANAETGDIACDHYHRFAEDITLMRNLGIKGYRFSIGWPRVIPQGKGAVNYLGLDFYDRLVDTLLMAGIEPYVTLYHWDLPQVLQDIGGWNNRDVCGYFADYAALMVRKLGDRVKYWTTFNEPWVIAFLGNETGEHAPGIKDQKVALQVAHNLLVAHGKAVTAIRDHAKNPKAGMVLSLWPDEANSDDPKANELAETGWRKNGGWFLDPLFKACYPASTFEAYGKLAPQIEPGDMALISQKLDFLGINYYSRSLFSPQGQIAPVPGSEYTEMGWEVQPPALRRLLVRLHQDYSKYELPPMYITENGAAFKDEVSADGNVHDPRRENFIREHLKECSLAINDGVDLRGYFVWSFLDNFEWAYGFEKRFGIVRVDYPTQKRILKDSGKWYSKVIAANKVEMPLKEAVR